MREEEASAWIINCNYSIRLSMLSANVFTAEWDGNGEDNLIIHNILSYVRQMAMNLSCLTHSHSSCLELYFDSRSSLPRWFKSEWVRERIVRRTGIRRQALTMRSKPVWFDVHKTRQTIVLISPSFFFSPRFLFSTTVPQKDIKRRFACWTLCWRFVSENINHC
jgi:hypothetical protein